MTPYTNNEVVPVILIKIEKGGEDEWLSSLIAQAKPPRENLNCTYQTQE